MPASVGKVGALAGGRRRGRRDDERAFSSCGSTNSTATTIPGRRFAKIHVWPWPEGPAEVGGGGASSFLCCRQEHCKSTLNNLQITPYVGLRLNRDLAICKYIPNILHIPLVWIAINNLDPNICKQHPHFEYLFSKYPLLGRQSAAAFRPARSSNPQFIAADWLAGRWRGNTR
jgi:hypothetical protein